MKTELKKINNDFNQLVSTIPIDYVSKLYNNQLYDIFKTLWIDNDVEGYESRKNDLIKLLNRMNNSQLSNFFKKESRAYYAVLYELYFLKFIESMEHTNLKILNDWVLRQVTDYLEEYEETKDIGCYNKAKNLLNEANIASDGLHTPEQILNLEKDIEILEAINTSKEVNKELLDSLKRFKDNYYIHVSVSEVRCEKDLEKFIIYFLKYEAPHGEATAESIINALKDKELLNSGYKLNARRIGRGILSDRPWFKGNKKYDSKTKQELTFWRYEI
jgi:hypothetical protein